MKRLTNKQIEAISAEIIEILIKEKKAAIENARTSWVYEKIYDELTEKYSVIRNFLLTQTELKNLYIKGFIYSITTPEDLDIFILKKADELIKEKIKMPIILSSNIIMKEIHLYNINAENFQLNVFFKHLKNKYKQ